MKTEGNKIIPVPSLRNVTTTSPRLIGTPVSSNIQNAIQNLVPLSNMSIQNPGGKPITNAGIPNIQKPESHSGQPPVTIAVLPIPNRIIPASGNSTGYHIPRGTAAVANISIPRGSMSTPIRSGGGTIATVSSGGSSNFMPSLSVLRPLGSSSWIATTSPGTTATTNIRPLTSTSNVSTSNFIPATVRHASMPVGTKITGPRMQSDQSGLRPVLVQKQIITGTSQMVHVTDGNKSFIKTTLPLRNAMTSVQPRLISTTTGCSTRLPTGIVPILVPSGASILKTQPPLGSTKIMVSQSGHGTPIQITSIPNSTNSKQASFQITGNPGLSQSSTIRPLVPVIVTSSSSNAVSVTSSNPPQNISHITFSKNNSTNSPNYAASLPATYFYEQNNSGPNYQSGPISTAGVTVRHPVVTSGFTTTIPHPRSNQTSTIISTPRLVSQFSLPINRITGPGNGGSLHHPGVLTNVVVASRGGPVISSVSSNNNSNSSRFNPTMIIDSNRPTSAHTTFIPVSSENSGDESNVQSLPVKPNASPRPSILRKRESDPSGPTKAQKNLIPLLNAASTNNNGTSSIIIPSVITSPPSSPKRPDSGSGGSGGSFGSSTTSAISSPAPLGEHNELELESGHNNSIRTLQTSNGSQILLSGGPHPQIVSNHLIANLSITGNPVEVSPRKKPRKQLLTGELQERKMEGEEMEFITEEKIKSEHYKEENSEHHVPVLTEHQQNQQQALAQSSTNKKPHVSLLSNYHQLWKSRHNHFMRHSDVKPKDERRPTLSDIASQKQILQKVNGWKIYHLRTQLENMASSEKEHSKKLTHYLEQFERNCDSNDREVNRVHELIKGNIQRNNVIKDQLLETHSNMIKIFEHKPTVTELIVKNSNRRIIKKKDKY